MKKKKVNEILFIQNNRKKKILKYSFLIFILLIVSITFIFISIESKKNNYVKYTEKSKIDYNVYLKDNDFFDDVFLAEKHQYIASLIDYIDANFNYELNLDDKIDYKYSYRIETNVNVRSKTTNNPLYNKTIVNTTSDAYRDNKSTIKINENIKINYNEYNDVIKKFIKIYNLDDIESNLTISLYITVVGACENITENESKESQMSLTIPLSTQTVAIELSDDLINTNNNVMKCDNNTFLEKLMFIIGCSILIIIVILIVQMFTYIVKSRTAETIYDKELKRILNNYGAYIQTLNNEFEFSEYQLLKLDTFDDMLEIRDTIKQPILMKENSDKTGVYFIIPSSTKILYVYRMKISDIKVDDNDKKEI